MSSQSPSFDEFASSYQDTMIDALGRMGGDASFYMEQKIRLMSRILRGKHARKILDFGSGIGMSIPYFRRYFPSAEVVCTDESLESIAILKTKYPQASTCGISELKPNSFDVVLLSNVLHHIDPRDRSTVVRRIGDLLVSDGRLVVFEHNPFNPVTRRVVDRCKFDEGVVLLKPSEVSGLVCAIEGISLEQQGFCTFVPQSLAVLTPLERLLTWCPMGGQHFTVARR